MLAGLPAADYPPSVWLADEATKRCAAKWAHGSQRPTGGISK